MMKKGLIIFIACGIVLVAIMAVVTILLAVSFHRVVVVEGVGGNPLPGAYITIERSSGPPEEVGRTDDNGELAFWTSPIPLPRRICAQATFYPTMCVNAISLVQQRIELPVPDIAP